MSDDGDAFVRHTDPETSKLAAVKARANNLKAQKAVAAIMNDGVARIDEEIFNARSSVPAYVTYSDRFFRHGREQLQARGLIGPTGKRGATTYGSPSDQWVKTSPDDFATTIIPTLEAEEVAEQERKAKSRKKKK